MAVRIIICEKCKGQFITENPQAPCPFCGFRDVSCGVVKDVTLKSVQDAHVACGRTKSPTIDLSMEEVGAKFYTRNMTIATLVEKTNSSLYRCMVQKDLVIFYNKRGKVITDDMRKTNINDLSHKI